MFIPCFSPKTAVKIQYFSTNLKTLNIDPYSRTIQELNRKSILVLILLQFHLSKLWDLNLL